MSNTESTPSAPPEIALVLVGAGHAHVEVLRSFAMRPLTTTAITLISPESYATYSGMVPGYLAGQYTLREAQIDARALAARAGAAFLPDRVVAIDRDARTLRLESYPDHAYDIVSFDVGSQPAHRDRIVDHPNTVLVKPIEIAARDVGRALDLPPPAGGRAVVVVGAGSGGVEIAFAIASRLRDEDGGSVTVCDRGPHPVAERGARAAAAVARAFARNHIRFVGGVEVEAVSRAGVQLDDGETLRADLVVWATGAGAPGIFRDSGLTLDRREFLAVDDHLRSLNDPKVFGAGDCVTPDSFPNLPKAGVYAVRQGPVLAANLRAATSGGRLQRFRPQQRFLSLLNSGDGKAVLSYGRFALRSRAAWWLKDYIDRSFIKRYARPRLAPPDSSMGEMQPCGGCAAKVGADVLERVLAKFDIPTAPHVVVGLAAADDAAVFRNPSDTGDSPLSVVTTDLFPPFSDDLFLVGRVAAVSAASDLYAMGAEGAAALALIAIPEQEPRLQEAALGSLLSGAVTALTEMGIPLVGGHTIAADTTLIGFSLHGFAAAEQVLTKRGAAAGDIVLLSKPLGTGVLLAAGRAGHADSDWIETCHASMLRSNGPMMRLLLAHGASAATDVTGFGLTGHLADLARHSEITAEIDSAAVPALPGAVELLSHGWRSSFHATNQRAHQGDGRNPLLLDPQTSGGLVATLAPERVDDFRQACEQAGEAVWVIGRMVEASDAGPIRVVSEPADEHGWKWMSSRKSKVESPKFRCRSTRRD